jgi:hypothetical protein
MLQTSYLKKQSIYNFIDLFSNDEKMFTPEQQESLKSLKTKIENRVRLSQNEIHLLQRILPHLN